MTTLERAARAVACAVLSAEVLRAPEIRSGKRTLHPHGGAFVVEAFVSNAFPVKFSAHRGDNRSNLARLPIINDYL